MTKRDLREVLDGQKCSKAGRSGTFAAQKDNKFGGPWLPGPIASVAYVSPKPCSFSWQAAVSLL